MSSLNLTPPPPPYRKHPQRKQENYKPYWIPKSDSLEKEISQAKDPVEIEPLTQSSMKLKEATIQKNLDMPSKPQKKETGKKKPRSLILIRKAQN